MKKSLFFMLTTAVLLLVPFVCNAQGEVVSSVSWEYNGGDIIENGISSNGNYNEITNSGVSGIGFSNHSYVYFNVDTAKLMTAPEYTYKILVDYYDGGYSDNHYNSKNFAISLSGGIPNVRMFPSLEASSIGASTAAGWKTAWLDVPSAEAGAVSFDGIVNSFNYNDGNVTGANIRIGNGTGRLSGFAVSKIEILTVRQPLKALEVSDAKYTLGTENEQDIDAPVTGFVNTTVELKNINTYNTSSIKLIVASVNKQNGKIEAISYDTIENLNAVNDTLKAGVEHNADTCDYKYFVWDANNNSLINCAPSTPCGFDVESRVRGAYISFEASEDDFDAVDKYVIFRDGEEFRTLYAPGGFLDISDDKHEYYVVSYDHMGMASEPTEIVSGETVEMLGIILEGESKSDVNKLSNGITFDTIDGIDVNDKCSEQAEKDGVLCRKTFDLSEIRNEPGRFSMLYFNIDDNEIDSDVAGVVFEITYFDEGTGNINLQYTNTSNSVATTKVAQRANTNTWKTVTVILNDAKLNNGINGNDVRISGVSASPVVYISSVKAIAGDKY